MMMDSGAYFLMSPPPSGLASPCAANANMTLNAISPLEMGTDLDFSTTLAATTTDQSSFSTSSSPFNYNASSSSPFDDPLDPFIESSLRPHHAGHTSSQHACSTPTDIKAHHSHLLHHSADYFAEHLCQSAPVERGCDSPLISMHPFAELAGCGLPDCDDLIDHSASFQSQDSLAFIGAIGGSLSSGSSDCSLSIGNAGSSVYDGPDDIITSNSIDFYSNYYNFNDCLPSDMLMTSQPTQQLYTNTAANSNSRGANGATGAPGTTATSTEKRSVLMNLLLDGSDIGAGYTSINCRSLKSRSDQQQQQQRCPLFKHGLVWGNHS